MVKRTSDEIKALEDQVFSLIPSKPEQAMSIGELCVEVFAGKRDKGRLTQRRRRMLHVALSSLRDAGRITTIGNNKATRYHRTSRKRK
jgi:hypothetical protein